MRHIIQSIISHHKIKLEITNVKKTEKYTKLWILNNTLFFLNNTLLNNQWIKEEVREEIRKYVEMIENESNTPKLLGHSESGADGNL